jgi:acylphosphatase
MPDAVRAHLHIAGSVQGVYYRESARRTAESLGLCGFARNLPDGRVEAVAEGPRLDVERFILWCHDGPPAAHVTSVEVRWEPPTGEFDGWTTRR